MKNVENDISLMKILSLSRIMVHICGIQIYSLEAGQFDSNYWKFT